DYTSSMKQDHAAGGLHALHHARSTETPPGQMRYTPGYGRASNVEVVDYALDAADGAGDLLGAGTPLERVDRARERHDTAVRRDVDLRQVRQLVGGQLGLHLRDDRDIVDDLADRPRGSGRGDPAADQPAAEQNGGEQQHDAERCRSHGSL